MELKDRFLHVVVSPRPSTNIAVPPSQAFIINNATIRTLDSWGDSDMCDLGADIITLIRTTPNTDSSNPLERQIVIVFEFRMLEYACPESPDMISVETLLTAQMSNFIDPSPSMIRAMKAITDSSPASLGDIEQSWLGHLKNKVQRGHIEHMGRMGKLVRFKQGWKWRPLSSSATEAGDYAGTWKGIPRSVWRRFL